MYKYFETSEGGQVLKKTIIGICDDEPQICILIQNKILAALNKLYGDDDEFFEIKIYGTAKELLDNIEDMDIVFLDIEMPEMDGLEAGKEILNKNSNCRIIMATSNDKRYGEAFRINAHRYLNKPLKEEEIEEAISSSMEKAVGGSTIEVYLNRIKYNIAQNEIFYLRAYNGYVEVYTANNVFTKNVSLEKMEEELDCRLFSRIHRQYLVGLKHISRVNKGVIQLKNGEELKISRRNLQKFEKDYVEYDLHYGG